ncbi:hypothetical protein B9Z55_023701 [Caenorhabditis nigoni]|uniref:Uncharacterized protein n=1 Tax=Caenorhabditis nigoni TaxID=1611254 RepID=A0A2G5SRI8_9PELO|nr:hypothetical protein B9Z55_023701 [Caenorhabditis nigoni]
MLGCNPVQINLMDIFHLSQLLSMIVRQSCPLICPIFFLSLELILLCVHLRLYSLPLIDLVLPIEETKKRIKEALEMPALCSHSPPSHRTQLEYEEVMAGQEKDQR